MHRLLFLQAQGQHAAANIVDDKGIIIQELTFLASYARAQNQLEISDGAALDSPISLSLLLLYVAAATSP